METKLHSSAYFGDARDFWWNRDFLQLMASRWQLDRVRHVLDAGCGVGHWGRALSPFLHRDCRLTGVDQEATWVAEAARRAEIQQLSDRFQYTQGDVTSLEFADQSFDMVTCQTLLIHVQDPKAVLLEFLRVLKPGGLLVVIEPNNLASSLVRNSRDFSMPVDQLLSLVRFQLICERGKAALGEGDNSIGDLIPGFMSELELKHIQVYQSDRTSPLFPPYDCSAQRAHMEQILKFDEQDVWIWEKQETLRNFIAGGGSQDEFLSLWNFARTQRRHDIDALKGNTLHTAGGGVFYLISGLKE